MQYEIVYCYYQRFNSVTCGCIQILHYTGAHNFLFQFSHFLNQFSQTLSVEKTSIIKWNQTEINNV